MLHPKPILCTYIVLMKLCVILDNITICEIVSITDTIAMIEDIILCTN